MVTKKIISIIIPAFNSQKTLGRCLRSAFASSIKGFEVIVVNDGSADQTDEVAKTYPVKLINQTKNLGAALSRNKGAKLAKGRILLFIDSDILLEKDSLKIVSDFFHQNPGTSVLQGVYDRKIASSNLFSIYKHYYHFYKFSKIKKDTIPSTSSFCLALKKKVFDKVGGFDPDFPAQSAAEDVDLGLRLRKNGFLIHLNKELEVAHLKSYTFSNFIKSEFIKIAANAKLMLRSKSKIGQYPVSKNSQKEMLNIVLSLLLSFLIPLALFYSLLFQSRAFTYFSILLVLVFVLLNHKVLSLIKGGKGIITALAVLPIIYLDMLIAQTALIYGVLDFWLFNNKY